MKKENRFYLAALEAPHLPRTLVCHTLSVWRQEAGSCSHVSAPSSTSDADQMDPTRRKR